MARRVARLSTTFRRSVSELGLLPSSPGFRAVLAKPPRTFGALIAGVRPSSGDSGGPLVFNVNGSGPVIGGIFSNWHEDHDNRSRWTPLGNAVDFLWTAIGLPLTRSLADEKLNTAVYTRLGSLNINDRARVIVDDDGLVGARIVSNAWDFPMRIGVEARVGQVRARGNVTLADRSISTETVWSSHFVNVGNDVSVAGSLEQGLPLKFEDFGLNVSFETPPGHTWIELGQLEAPIPGIYGDYTVRAGGILQLSDGMYAFRSLTLESNSDLLVNGLQPTWVFVLNSGSVTMRGDMSAFAENVFFGMPNANSVFIGAEWRGTLVAPLASVTADMIPDARLEGSFFVGSFELHQGRWLRHIPFAGSWTPVCTNGFQDCS